MDEGIRGPSRTAVLTAVARALQREEPQPWIMDDRLALGLAGPEGLVLLGRLRAEVPRPHLLAFSRWMCVRARFAEDIVEQAAAGGIGQYVRRLEFALAADEIPQTGNLPVSHGIGSYKYPTCSHVLREGEADERDGRW